MLRIHIQGQKRHLYELPDNGKEGNAFSTLTNGTNSVLQLRMPKISRIQEEMTIPGPENEKNK